LAVGVTASALCRTDPMRATREAASAMSRTKHEDDEGADFVIAARLNSIICNAG